MVLNDENTWYGVLASTMFVLHVMVHTTTKYTLVQLEFGWDSILKTCHKANWQIIEKCKQHLIDEGNQQENCNKKEHTNNNGNKVLLKNG